MSNLPKISKVLLRILCTFVLVIRSRDWNDGSVFMIEINGVNCVSLLADR